MLWRKSKFCCKVAYSLVKCCKIILLLALLFMFYHKFFREILNCLIKYLKVGKLPSESFYEISFFTLYLFLIKRDLTYKTQLITLQFSQMLPYFIKSRRVSLLYNHFQLSQFSSLKSECVCAVFFYNWYVSQLSSSHIFWKWD